MAAGADSQTGVELPGFTDLGQTLFFRSTAKDSTDLRIQYCLQLSSQFIFFVPPSPPPKKNGIPARVRVSPSRVKNLLAKRDPAASDDDDSTPRSDHFTQFPLLRMAEMALAKEGGKFKYIAI
jgi:hypothetical protein